MGATQSDSSIPQSIKDIDPSVLLVAFLLSEKESHDEDQQQQEMWARIWAAGPAAIRTLSMEHIKLGVFLFLGANNVGP